MKSRAPGGESSLTGGCLGHWTGRGPGRGQGPGLKNKMPRPGPLTGAGNCGGGPPVSRPQRPRNEHYA